MPLEGYISADDTRCGSGVGLTKDQLLQCAYRPLWVWLRGTLLTTYWLAWVAMLVTAILVIKDTPKCRTPPPLQWWQRSPMYQLLVPSFSDGGRPLNGQGDLAGVESRLSYIQELGVKTVCLSPVFNSPLEDPSSVIDFKAIAPHFGTLDDFKSLIREVKEKEMKLVLDFIPNHSSDQHQWFQKSIFREDPYTHYYVWKKEAGKDKAGNPMPPNNWRSVYGGSAWQWCVHRQEFYLHQFLPEQPDLNYRSPELLQEIKDTLKFWLKMGVDGFRLNAVAHLLEDEKFQDEPMTEDDTYNRTFNLPEVLDILHEFRAVLDNSSIDEPKVLLVEDRLPVDALPLYYGNATYPLAHLAISTEFSTYIRHNVTALQMFEAVRLWLAHLPEGTWPNWMVGDEDTNRLTSRVGSSLADAISMVTLLLPGTPITYYGDEIGMEDIENPTEDSLAVRAGAARYSEVSRSPMQWSTAINAGFSMANHSWLPVNANYKTVNVEVEEHADWSHIKVYRALVKTRNAEAVMSGDLDLQLLGDQVLAYTRIKKGSPGILVAVNFADIIVTVDLTTLKYVPSKSSVLAFSTTFKDSSYNVRSKISNNAVLLPGKGGVVLTFVPDFPINTSSGSH